MGGAGALLVAGRSDIHDVHDNDVANECGTVRNTALTLNTPSRGHKKSVSEDQGAIGWARVVG